MPDQTPNSQSPKKPQGKSLSPQHPQQEAQQEGQSLSPSASSPSPSQAPPAAPGSRRIRNIFVVLGLGILALFAALLTTTLLYLRSEMRTLVLDRDAQLLGSIAQHLYAKAAPVEFPEIDLLEMAMESSELRGVIGVRVFNKDGQLLARAPASLYPVALDTADTTQLQRGQPVTRFFPAATLGSLFRDADPAAGSQTAPLLEVVTPLQNPHEQTVAALQYWLDGSTIHREFRTLDRSLAGLGLLILLGGGAILIAILITARKRLQRLATLLEHRNRSLHHANQQLARTARSAAIGSVTSHLFHGLKNPLAGLQSYLRLSAGDDEAVALTHRMQSLINETLAVIQEESSDQTNVTMTLPEWAAFIRDRLQPEAEAAGACLNVQTRGSWSLPAHQARLGLLVLRNLVENACQAAPEGSRVSVDAQVHSSGLFVTVRDEGPGLPEFIRQNLFQPVRSSKENGTGIGLAIARLIAEQIPADLSLLHTGPHGTSFQLHLSP